MTLEFTLNQLVLRQNSRFLPGTPLLYRIFPKNYSTSHSPPSSGSSSLYEPLFFLKYLFLSSYILCPKQKNVNPNS